MRARNGGFDRGAFLSTGIAGALALRGAKPPWGTAAASEPTALVTADQQGYVAVVALVRGRTTARLATIGDPRSVESGRGGHAVVAHSAAGAVTLIEGRPPRVRRVLRGFQTPRYTAMAPDGRHAYVSDGGSGELVTIDLQRGNVLARTEVGAGARHLSIAPGGRTLWVALGSSASVIVVVDVTLPARPRIARRIAPPFLAHDVGFTPGGSRVWITAGRERRLAVFAASGRSPIRELPAASLRVHDLRTGRPRRRTAVALGSYNVQRGGDHVLTPSLNHGTLTVLGLDGVVRREITVARAAHDACVLR